MNEAYINSLKEALKLSPDNIPLRKLLAEGLFQLQEYQEAETQLKLILNTSDDFDIKTKLAEVYFQLEKYAASIILLEELTKNTNDLSLKVLLTKAYIKENSLDKAIEIYHEILEDNPEFRDEALDEALRMPSFQDEVLDELSLRDARFLEKPTIDFSNVGGMSSVKKEIDLKIIKPLEQADLYKAYGKKIGGGILMYGPPGCGKTHIAKATAGEINANFISVSLNDILDMWIGKSEKNLHELFELARKNTPCVVFIDEIDALGANRNDLKQSAGRQLINQFLQELDGIDNNNEGVLILGATNTPWNMDPAFRRPGRFDRIVFVSPPDQESRETIFNIKLDGKPIEKIDYQTLAKKTDKYSGADIEAVVDIAIEQKLEDSFKDGIPKPITTKDILKACKKHKPTTLEWFGTAKNYALFSNSNGLYDVILEYLDKKK